MRRASRWILGGLGALVLLAAVVVAALPAVIGWLAVNRWEALTGRPASIDRVEVRLRDGRFEFQGVRLADRAPGPPFVEIERMSGVLRWEALLRGEFRARTLDITAPTVRIVRTAPGELSVSGLFRPSGGTSGSAWVSVRLEQGRLTRGRIVFEDRAVSPPRIIEARDITLDVRDVSSRPGEAQGTATLALMLAGAPVRLDADQIGLAPAHARGTLTLGELDLAPFLAYAPSDAAVTPSRGRLAGRVEMTTFEAAAAALFAREFPGGAPPDGVDEILARLREREPVPEGAGRALAQGRLEAARRALIEGGGIEADRLEVADGEAEVSVSGAGRVELELAP